VSGGTPAASTASAPSAAKTTVENCQPVTDAQVAALFDRWNASLATGNPQQVVANYAPVSFLLPTVSSQPRTTAQEKRDYFHHFLENQPSGRIDQRWISVGCNTVIDAGLYTFNFAKNGATVRARYTFTYQWDGKQWLISHHHSSMLPSSK
jgi:uncharacterized protein (TIGR02246 family)